MNPILDCFSATADRFPERIAIADREKSYTFRELWHKAACLAGAIPSHGRAIGVFVNREAETAVLFLAAVFSGNYYVPLDPDMPESKREIILEDAEIGLVLGNESNRSMLGAYEGSFLTIAECAASECPVPEATDDTPLYMLYTSGSTGRPKGVLKSHGAVISFLTAYTKRFPFSEQDVIGNQTPFFFDASAKDLYLMMKTGARLEILPTELFSFPVRLIEYLNERGVTFISWVPTALCIVSQLNTFTEIKPSTLRRVFFVGEVFPRKQLDKWRRALPELEYVNLYGSSELAGVCCYYPVGNDLPEDAPIPLGIPLDNCQVLLMDEGRPVTKPGQVGEIYVASPALALCYYHDEEKTEKCFFEMTFPDGVTRRTFRTGDLASYDDHGNIVFSSRKDYQIKHMGCRIELGEIESVADRLSEIRRCCCLYNTEKKQITLFCELSDGCDWNGRQVRSALKGMLADYMLPTKVIIMENLPINANGKIHRQALMAQL